MDPKFSSERTVLTAGVNELFETCDRFKNFVYISLGRHFSGEWGVMCDEDKAQNDEALKSGEARIHSEYTFRKGQHDEKKIWIITEWDRSVTTVLFPEEY